MRMILCCLQGGLAHLQMLLDALGDFSTAHFISVSEEKSKTIIHGCSGPFGYYRKQLESVDCYQYLG